MERQLKFDFLSNFELAVRWNTRAHIRRRVPPAAPVGFVSTTRAGRTIQHNWRFYFTPAERVLLVQGLQEQAA